MSRKLKLTFCGGVSTVTGANFLLEDLEAKVPLRLLIDCGMVQGKRFAMEENQKPFPYNPKFIDYLFITHAHIDHIGRVPKLVRDGFEGRIVSTPETKAIAELMLADALQVLRQECEQVGDVPFYDESNIAKAMSLWQSLPYHESMKIREGISIYIKDAGHVLGSAMFEITIDAEPHGTNAEPRGKIGKLVFTGDLGNSPTPILRDTEKVEDANYLVMESVYGDRNHEGEEGRRERLKQVVNEAVSRGGALLVPAFSLEKTQVLLSELNQLVETKAIPRVSVFLDSPLAIKITEVYRSMKKDFNTETKKEIASGDDIFNFPMLHLTKRTGQSRAIEEAPNPKIIIAGSGMSNGGRIIHHERRYLGDPKSTILFIGYQAAGSLGREIQEGARRVTIEGAVIPVHARVETITGYSSHKDSEHLVDFVSDTAESLKKVFVVMGEPKAALFLVQRLRDYLGVDAVHPELGESVELGF